MYNITDYFDDLPQMHLMRIYRFGETELFGFAFGRENEECIFLHILCRFRIGRTGDRFSIMTIDGNTSSQRFYNAAAPMLYQRVVKAEIVHQHNLIIDIGDWQMEILPDKDDEEAWRIFTDKLPNKTVVATFNSVVVE